MTSEETVARVFREEHGRAVASLVRRFGDLDVAEDAVHEAFVRAVRHWPAEGPPPSPAGRILTTARNAALDRLRREPKREDKQAQAALLRAADDEPPEEGAVRDDRLPLIFTCCHAEIARAFLVPEATMAGGTSQR